jgi:hypothetical protein
VVIQIVDEDGVLAIEREDHPPVGVYFHSPLTGEFPLERVKAPGGGVHIEGLFGTIECFELEPQFVRVGRLNACLRAGLEKLP